MTLIHASISDFRASLAKVKYRDWKFLVELDVTRCYLVIEANTEDTQKPGERLTWRSRKWALSPYMTKGEVVRTAFKAVLTALEHEAREEFLYRDVPIFDPHTDVDKLWELRVQPGSIDKGE